MSQPFGGAPLPGLQEFKSEANKTGSKIFPFFPRHFNFALMLSQLPDYKVPYTPYHSPSPMPVFSHRLVAILMIVAMEAFMLASMLWLVAKLVGVGGNLCAGFNTVGGVGFGGIGCGGGVGGGSLCARCSA